MKNLGIAHLYQGQADKVVAFSDLLQKLNLSADSVAYVGDDVIDLPVMTKLVLLLLLLMHMTRSNNTQI
ncbi:3-deoxy-D-manno-octulosonate 8-phosphate phosphatase (EC [uncultured Gammaproteobacteria bacterium]|nr:3-deoxy-D-manno-octulosonate 8-phosphate phosphatase (EC [uncultured Gammaproteobacteria bacterium]